MKSTNLKIANLKMTNLKISISPDKWESFQKQWQQPWWHRNLRYGQALYNFFDLDKIKDSSLQKELDMLYNSDGDKAGVIFWSIFEIN